MWKKALKLVTILVIFTTVLYGCSSQSTNSSVNSQNTNKNTQWPSTLRIGALEPMTGPGAPTGQQDMNGYKLAIDEINKAGGIDGTKLDLITEDHETNAAKGVLGMNKLVNIDKVPLIFQSYTNIMLATASIGEKNKTVMINPAATTPVLKGLSSYLVSTVPSETIYCQALADYAYHTLGLKKLAILHANDDQGSSTSDAMVKAWKKLGGTIKTIEVADTNPTDFKSQLTKIKSANPDAVYATYAGKHISMILNQAKELGINFPILGASFWGIPETLTAKGASEGVLYAAQAWDPKNPPNEMAKKFVEHYRAVYHQDPVPKPTGTYAGVYIVKDVLEYLKKKNLPPTGEEIRNAMTKIKSYKTPFGELTFNNDGNISVPITIMTVKEGNFKKVKDVDPAVFKQFR